MALDHRYNQMQALRSLGGTVVYPLQILVDAPIRFSRDLIHYLSSRERLFIENRLLRDELIELQAKQLRFEALQLENDRLRALLNTANRAPEQMRIAHLLSVDLNPFRQQVVINKGKSDQVYAGQPMLHPDGVMGQILVANWSSATALLISDPEHALPVFVARTGLRAMLIGTGNPKRLILRHVPPQEDIVIGDRLLTSGLGGRFPSDYPVAKIVRVEHLPGQSFLTIEAEPLAALDRAHEVLLLWTQEVLENPSLKTESEHPD